MLRNYLRLAIRKFLKQKGNTAIKLFSLCIGVVSVFYITVYIQEEMSFDTFHQKQAKIFRINTEIVTPTGSLPLALSATSVGEYLKSNSPAVSDFVRINKEYGSRVLRAGSNIFTEKENIYYADHNFFDFFDFELVAGDSKRHF